MTVALADAADVVVRATRERRAGCCSEPRVSIDGETSIPTGLRPIGHVGVYRFEVRRERIELTLAAFRCPTPCTRSSPRATPVTVPAADADEFVREHMPRLVRHVAVDAPGIDLPAAERPTARAHRAVRAVAPARLRARLALRRRSRSRIARRGRRTATTSPRTRSAVASKRSGRMPRPSRSRQPGRCRGSTPPSSPSQLLPALEALDGVAIEIHGERPRYRELTGDPHVAVSTVESTDPDWFDLGVIVTIDGRTIPFAPLFTALSRGRRKLLLSDGRYFSLAHPSLQRLRDLIEEAGELAEWETGPRISRYQTALWADFEDVADEAEPAVSWRATAEALREARRHPADRRCRPVCRRSCVPTSATGFEWLAFLWQHRLGGILADDMGLGKTLQMLALIAHTSEAGETRPFLVVAPTSVLSTWRERGRPLRPGPAGRRRRRHAREARDRRWRMPRPPQISSSPRTRCSASMSAEFAEVEWAGLVLDEAQFVKNSQTKAYRAARDLRADVTFAITGTPMENSLTELWALLSLAAPGLFASARRFRDEYVGPIEQGKVPENQEGGDYRARRLERLRRRIRPLVLRRTKELVAADLPPKQEQEVRIELGPAHRALYDAVLQRERQKVLGLLDDLDRNRFIVFRSLTLLRMLSLAPELVDPANAHIAPSKLTALFEQLDEIVAEGHRTLVFSQFTSFLALVADAARGARHPVRLPRRLDPRS